MLGAGEVVAEPSAEWWAPVRQTSEQGPSQSSYALGTLD